MWRDDRNIASDEASRALLIGLFAEIEPFAERLLQERADLRERVSGWPGDARTRVLGLLGVVAWEIFSSNNQVVGPEDEIYDLGTWRSSGGFIADVVNDRLGEGRFDYLDFYMGFLGRDQDIRPLYVRTFGFLSEQGCRWCYAPPAIFLISLKDARDESNDPEAYDPESAIRGHLEREREDEELRSSLDEINRDAFEKAVDSPPVEVLAYEKVYGKRPAYIRHEM